MGSQQLKTYKLILSYDGTEYHGWQYQPNFRTIQGTVEDCLSRILGKKHEICGASRTDSGVHARGQAGHFRTRSPVSGSQIRQGLRHILPPDISLVSLRKVPNTFHSRFHATGKIYQYAIRNATHRDPFVSRFETLIRVPLNRSLMSRAAKLCIGRKDFAAFRSSGSGSKSTIRTLSRVTVAQKDLNIVITFQGEGFLYHMVRNLSASLIEVGSGRQTAKDFAEFLEAGKRQGAPRCAPAQGLTLIRVFY